MITDTFTDTAVWEQVNPPLFVIYEDLLLPQLAHHGDSIVLGHTNDLPGKLGDFDVPLGEPCSPGQPVPDECYGSAPLYTFLRQDAQGHLTAANHRVVPNVSTPLKLLRRDIDDMTTSVAARGSQALISWSYIEHTGPRRLKFQRFTLSGSPPMLSFQGSPQTLLNLGDIEPGASGLQHRVALSSDGLAVFTWNSAGDDGAQDVYLRCLDAGGAYQPCGIDLDGDGLINNLDCEPYNQYLTYDLDQDGRCDERAGGITQCRDECAQVHAGDSQATSLCQGQCDLDNCRYDTPFPVLLGTQYDGSHPNRAECEAVFKPRLVPSTPQEFVDVLYVATTTTAGNVCRTIFGNPTQQDTDGDDVGDRCEYDPQLRIQSVDHPYTVTFEQASDGALWMTTCYDNKIDIDFSATGGLLVWENGQYQSVTVDTNGQLTDDPLVQRATAGACECDPSLGLLCDDLCPRAPGGEYRGGIGSDDFAWDPVRAIQTLDYDQLPGGDPDWEMFGDLPLLTFHSRRVEFTHEDQERSHHLGWGYEEQRDLNEAAGFPPIDLAGKKVWVRVAHRDQASQDVVDNISDWYPVSDQPMGPLWPSACTTVSVTAQLEWAGQASGGPSSAWGGPYQPRFRRELHLLFRDQQTRDLYLATYPRVGALPSGLAHMSQAPGASKDFDLAQFASVSGVMDTALVGQSLGVSEALFLYGCQESGPSPAPTPAPPPLAGTQAAGSGPSCELWIGLPEHPDNVLLLAQDVYQASQAPHLIGARLIAHPDGNRLLAVGRAPDGVAPGPLQVWSMALDTGDWQEEATLRALADLEGFSIATDGPRQRALIFGGQQGAACSSRLYVLDLSSLVLTAVETPSTPLPIARKDAGLHIDALGNALYVYGGWNGDTLADLWRLDLTSLSWTLLGDGTQGPGPRRNALVLRDSSTGRLWVAGGDDPPPVGQGIGFWGLDKDGAWHLRETLKPREPGSGPFTGQFDPGYDTSYPIALEEGLSLPGQLTRVTLQAQSPHLGLAIRDLAGSELGRDLAESTDNYVTFVGRGDYFALVLAGPGYQPGEAAGYTLHAQPAEPLELASYQARSRTNRVLQVGTMAFVGGAGGIEAVDLSYPAAPQRRGALPLLGSVQDLALCGQSLLCAAVSWSQRSLVLVDVSDPTDLQVVGDLSTFGLSRSLAVLGQTVFLAHGVAGVSIVDISDVTNPALIETIQPGGLVLDVSVQGHHLYVSTIQPRRVNIYEIHGYGSPTLAGEITPAQAVDEMRLDGTELHLSELNRGQLARCVAGWHCPRGGRAEVFDIADLAAPVRLGSYQGQPATTVHLRSQRDILLLRKEKGFWTFRAVPVAQ